MRPSTTGGRKYGGMEVSDAKRLKALEEENAQAEEAAGGVDDGRLDAARDARKKLLTPGSRRTAVTWAMKEKSYSQRRACASGRDRSAGLSLRVEATGRCRAAGQAAGTGVGTAPVRLSAPAHSAEAGGLGGELEEALPHLPGGAADRAQARRSQAGARDPGADGDPAGTEPALVARLRLRHAVGWPALPHPMRHRRLQPGVPGDRRRHLALRPSCRPRTRPDRRAAGLSPAWWSATTAPS